MPRLILLVAVLLLVAGCPDRASDVVSAHRSSVMPALDAIQSAVEEIRQHAALAEDTLEYSGAALHFEDPEDGASEGILVTIDAYGKARESGSYESTGWHDDRFWSWPLGGTTGAREVLELDGEAVRAAFLVLERMKFALVIKTIVRVEPKYLESKWGSIHYEKGRFEGEGWLVDLETRIVHGGCRFATTNDPVMLTASEPERIQAALEFDLEYQIRKAARKALAEKLPSTVLE